MSAVHEKNRVVQEALDAANKLRMLADQAEERCEDDGCSVVCGVIRDCAFKIRGMAERERAMHQRRGLWRV